MTLHLVEFINQSPVSQAGTVAPAENVSWLPRPHTRNKLQWLQRKSNAPFN